MKKWLYLFFAFLFVSALVIASQVMRKQTPVLSQVSVEAAPVVQQQEENVADISDLQPQDGPLADIDVQKLIDVASAEGLKPKTLKAALNSYAWARERGKLGENKNTLTVVDFSLASYKKRMWVIDLQENKVLMKLYTSHGKGSGEDYATRFSNQFGTEASSVGLYVTSEIYYGKHDKSMRIEGLEKGINSNARDRAIVIHSAYYASPEYIRSHHYAGRSWGCFAVAPESKDKLLHYIKGGSALFTYAASEDHDPIVKNGPIAIV